jgi:Ca-activated chloride channel family protein
LKRLRFGLLLLIVLNNPFSLSAQRAPAKSAPVLTRIEFLFDASQSMFGRWQSGAKIDVARNLMTQMLDSLRKLSNVELALRVYGHQKQYPPQDCNDSRLEVPFSKGNIDDIQAVLKRLVPKGTTPIAKSLELCGEDFPSSPARNIVILITDGIEECGGDPCAISLALQKKGIFLRPFVIGMGLDESLKKTFDCVGRYFDATNESTFREALNVVISQALDNTTLQVNLLDEQFNPTETNVGMTFYDTFSGNPKYNFIHTLNSRGNPDTLVIDPLLTYRIVVHTIPEVSKDGILLTPGKHTTVALDAPQGTLSIKYDGTAEARKVQAIIRKKNELRTLHVMEINSAEKLITGGYDLEILTLPRTYLNDVRIDQSKTTTVQVPRPGIITFVCSGQGYGSIFLANEKELKFVCNLDENLTRESAILQPGRYKVIFRPKNSRETIYTIEKDFTIVSGESNVIVIN